MKVVPLKKFRQFTDCQLCFDLHESGSIKLELWREGQLLAAPTLDVSPLCDGEIVMKWSALSFDILTAMMKQDMLGAYGPAKLDGKPVYTGILDARLFKREGVAVAAG